MRILVNYRLQFYRSLLFRPVRTDNLGFMMYADIAKRTNDLNQIAEALMGEQIERICDDSDIRKSWRTDYFTIQNVNMRIVDDTSM